MLFPVLIVQQSQRQISNTKEMIEKKICCLQETKVKEELVQINNFGNRQ